MILTAFFLLVGYFIYTSLQWHIVNVIAKTPNLSDSKVQCLRDIATKMKQPKTSNK